MNKDSYSRRRDQNHGRQNLSNLRSTCDDVIVRGSREQIVTSWQNLSDQARIDGDMVKAERFGQQAEHYRRVGIESACI